MGFEVTDNMNEFKYEALLNGGESTEEFELEEYVSGEFTSSSSSINFSSLSPSPSSFFLKRLTQLAWSMDGGRKLEVECFQPQTHVIWRSPF